MSTRRRPSDRPRHRLVAATAFLLASFALIGGGGTWAYWTASTSISTGPLNAGFMNLTTAAGTTFSVNDLTPGESQALEVTIRNEGTPPVTWTARGSRAASPAWTYPGTPLEVHASSGSASNVGSYPRVGQCDGSAPTSGWVDLTTGEAPLTSGDSALEPGESVTLCLVIRMKPSAGNDAQNHSGALLLTFDTEQVPS